MSNLYDYDQQTKIDGFGVDHSNFSLRDEIEYNFKRAKEKEMQQSLKPGSYQDDYLGKMKAKQIVEDQQRSVMPTQPASLQFDGQNLIWLENGKPVKYYPAQSGHNGFQSEQYTNVSGEGPIPQGNYLLEKGSGQDYNNKEKMSWWRRKILNQKPWYELPYGWGKSRIPIKPQTGTNTFSRDQMYVHGGEVPGSAGCIDLTHYNDDFYNDFQKYNDNLSLEVKYPKDW